MEAKEARGADAAAPGLWNRWVLAVGAAGLAAGAALLGWNAAVELARVKDERDAEARGRKDAEERLASLIKRTKAEGPLRHEIVPVVDPRASAASKAPAAPVAKPTGKGWRSSVVAMGVASCCFRISRNTPRQGALAPDARAVIRLEPWVPASVLRGLGGFSHAIILYGFHSNTDEAKREAAAVTTGNLVKPLVKPPALKGKSIGRLATRAPHRPNNVGLTVATVRAVWDGETLQGDAPASLRKGAGAAGPGGWLLVGGIDFTQGTPIIDIKPFVPAYDAPEAARAPSWVAGGVRAETARRPVFWRRAALEAADAACREGGGSRLYGGEARALVRAATQVLASDVRSDFQMGGRAAVEGRAVAFWIDGLLLSVRRARLDPAASAPAGYERVDPLGAVRLGGGLGEVRLGEAGEAGEAAGAAAADSAAVLVEAAVPDARLAPIGSFEPDLVLSAELWPEKREGGPEEERKGQPRIEGATSDSAVAKEAAAPRGGEESVSSSWELLSASRESKDGTLG